MSADQQITGPMRRVWNDADESRHKAGEAYRVMDEAHHELAQALNINCEEPSIEQVRAQVLRAIDQASAARQYHKDLLKLYALVGGFDPPKGEAA